MSIFGSILSKIFHHSEQGTVQASTAPGTTPSKPAAPATDGKPAAAVPGGSTPLAAVDVAKVLDGLKQKSKEKDIDWRRSIVDLMKLLDLDSGLSARRDLAKELNYEGDTKDTATMNVWLHKQVIAKLAENGGKVPDDLKS